VSPPALESHIPLDPTERSEATLPLRWKIGDEILSFLTRSYCQRRAA
jgi:hypothetical protein